MSKLTIAGSVLVLALGWSGISAAQSTYAERLGWKPGDRVVIFHNDDAGMSYDSNQGIIESMEKGVATSVSIMFPCAWVSEYAHYLKDHPEVDAGVHLTLTSEWDNYRWGPVAGKPAVPGLTDSEGCLWDNVALVVEHGSADEVEREIRAQVGRCQAMGIKPTHLDSHMGTLFATPAFAERYVKVGIELGIPVMLPGGHMTYVSKQNPEAAAGAKAFAEILWTGGLPVIDDVITDVYDWKSFDEKKAKLLEVLKGLQPGITEIIVHSTKPTEWFARISGSGATREADLKVMLDPDIAQTVRDQGIVLTTWRELKQRRDAVTAAAANPTK